MSAWLVLGAIVCGVGAIAARSLVRSALWLAATSVLLSILIYLRGAPVVAVVELSVGVGLVAVLFVFAVGIAGEDGVGEQPTVPLLLALALTVPTAALLLWLIFAAGWPAALAASAQPTVATALWQQRAADVLGQVVLIIAGALGVVTILGGAPRPLSARTNGVAKLHAETAPLAVHPDATPLDAAPEPALTGAAPARSPVANGAAREEVTF